MTLHTELVSKLVLCLIAAAVVAYRHRRPGTLKPEQAGQLLGIMAIIAALAWANFGFLHGSGAIHNWEFFHYFLGSKYFAELGYDGIYAASLAAERELGLDRPRPSHVRDLRSNEVVPTAAVEEHAREVKGRFSAQRWHDFVADNGHFMRANSAGYLDMVRRDHGYNPTPTWTFMARIVSARLAASDRSLAALAWLDPLLLTLLSAAIFAGCGSRVGCLSVIIFGLGYPWRFHFVGGAFLRQDWLLAVGIGLVAVRGKRYGLGGLAVAYAAAVRIFPAAFLLGPAVLVVRGLLRREGTAWARRLAAGFVLGLALFFALGCLTGRGAAAWTEFGHNLAKHRGTWLTNNVGLANVVLYDLATMRRDDVRWELPEPWLFWQEKMNRLAGQRRPLTATLSGIMLALAIAAAWRLERWQAMVVGMAAIFALVLLTCYYWAMLALVPLGRGRWGPSAGWLLISGGLFALNLATPSFEMIYGLMSWALTIFFVAWLAPDAWKTVKELLQRSRV